MRYSASPHSKQTVNDVLSSDQIGQVFSRAKVSAALTSSASVDPHCGHVLAMLWRSVTQPEYTRRDPEPCCAFLTLSDGGHSAV